MDRTDRLTDTSTLVLNFFFFSSCKLQKTLPVTITVVWSCDTALGVLSLLFDEWRICLTVRLWAPSDRHAPAPCIQIYPFTQTPALLCCGSDTPSRGTSESQWNFPPLHIWNCHTMWHDSRIQKAVWMGPKIGGQLLGVGLCFKVWLSLFSVHPSPFATQTGV